MSDLLQNVRELSPDKKQCLETAVVLSAIFLFFSLLQNNVTFGWLSFGLLIAALIIPKLFYPLAKVWFGLALLLGWFSSRILLSLLFFLLVTPIGLIRRLIGKDSLMLREFKKSKKSVFIERNHKFTADDLKTPF